MGSAFTFLIIGAVLCSVAVAATLIRRLPLTTAMVYLPLGWLLGPDVTSIIPLVVTEKTFFLEYVAGITILISLFGAGLKARLPLGNRLWLTSLRLAYPSMILSVLLVALCGIYLFHLPWAYAILLGAMMAPTDPVLASDVQIERPLDPVPLRFSLTSEAGLNDGTAFPFLLLGLSLLAAGDVKGTVLHWLAYELLLATVAGLALGFTLSTLIGRCVLYLRKAHRHAFGLGYFLSPGLIALNYGLAQSIGLNGFLAVFAAGVALRRIELKDSGEKAELPLISPELSEQEKAATDPKKAPLFLVELLLQFTTQLEEIGEIAVVVLVGALLSIQSFSWTIIIFAALLFLAIRPLAVFAGSVGCELSLRDRTVISWFGIRGIGSLYYLSYAVQHGMGGLAGQQIVAVVLGTVAISVAMHGMSVTPLMNWYTRQLKGGAKTG